MAATTELRAVINATDNASSVFGKFAANAKSSLGNVNNQLIGMAKGATAFGAAAATGLGAAVGFAVKSASEMQNLRTSMDVLTGSAEKGAEIFTKLNKMGASTPFETKDLADATKTMLSFGIGSDKVLDNLKMLGDVSLGNKEKLAGLSLAFSQVQSTGRLMGQDLLQMINNGFNPLTIISQKTGKSMSVLKEEMAAGAISADMVTEAFKTATSEGGLFYQGMDKGSQNLEGRMSTLKDNIGMAARAVIGLSSTGEVVKGGLFDKVSNAVSNLINWLNQNQEAIVRVASAFMEKFLAAAQAAINIIVTIIKFFMEHQNLTQSLAIAVGVVLTAAFAAWAVSVIAATWPILAIIAAITAVVFAIKYLISHWGDIRAFFARIGEAAGVVGNAIRNAFVGIWDGIKAGIKAGINAIIKVVNIAIKGFNFLPGPNIPTIPMLAKGGAVSAGKPHIVGERGPELFVPSSQGRIIPNDKLAGGGVTVNANFYGDMNVRSQADIDNIVREVGRQINLSLKGGY